MRRKPKETIGARIDDRTKWILQEYADLKKTTLSDVISDILDEAVDGGYGDRFVKSTLEHFGEMYDEYTTMDRYDISKIKEIISKMDISSPTLFNSGLYDILGKLTTLHKFNLITNEEVEECIEATNKKYEESAKISKKIAAEYYADFKKKKAKEDTSE